MNGFQIRKIFLKNMNNKCNLMLILWKKFRKTD
jgi:hypothetical protein